MTREDIDWSILRGALIIFLTCLTISGGLLYASFYFKNEMNNEFRRNDAMFRSISSKYFAVDEEETQIKNYYPLFVDLYNKGVIGRERRLNWIEVLRNAGDEINIPGLSYEIKSQEVHQPKFAVTLGKFKLYRSVMNLKLQLLHEGDLFRLFSALNEHALGAYNVSTCSISTLGSTITENVNKGNVDVSCELTWHTIKLASGKELKV